MRKKIAFFLIIFAFFVPPREADFLNFNAKYAQAAEIPEVVINEICWMGNHTSSTAEWIELYNNTAEEVDVTGWKIISQDGKPEITLEGKIGANGYYLTERTDDSTVPEIKADLVISFGSGLSNSGEQLMLYNLGGLKIDMTPAVGEKNGWAAGDNEVKYTMERINPLLSGEDKSNWASSLSDSGTPKKINSTYSAKIIKMDSPQPATSTPEVNEQQNDSPENLVNNNSNTEVKKKTKNEKEQDKKETKSKIFILRQGAVLPGKIVINEIYPNPKNFKAEKEFIEVKNIGGQEINLAGWIIKNKFNLYEINNADFPVTIIPAGGFFVLPRIITNIPLSNEGDTVELWSDSEKADEVSYKEPAISGAAYIREQDKWQWTSVATPDKDNIFVPPNRNPSAVIASSGIKEALAGQEILFDATDSFDPDRDKLSYLWKISDGEKFEGAVMNKRFDSPGNYEISLRVTDEHQEEGITQIKIKILENPWLEKMSASEPVPMNYLTGAKKSTDFLPAQEWANVTISEIMPNPDTKAQDEWIKLVNHENYDVNLGGWTLDDMEGGSHPYQIPEDVTIVANGFLSFARDKTGLALNNDNDEVRLFNPDGNLADSEKYEKTTKGQSIMFHDPDASPTEAEVMGAAAGPQDKRTGAAWDELEKYKNKEITLQGKVASIPGALGKQIFYLTDETYGMEVYCFKSDFPDLELGDLISITGNLTENDGWRLTINGAHDITILSYEHPPLAREVGNFDDMKKHLHGLVMVSGQVLAKHSPNLFLGFGKEELKIYIKDSANIYLSDIKASNTISVIGIADLLNNEYRLLPRSQEDIQKLAPGEVLGETAQRADSLATETASSTDYSNLGTDASEADTRKRNIILLSGSLLVLIVVAIVVKRKIE